jgi:AbrB family looped-hinge helix DNA binding protein
MIQDEHYTLDIGSSGRITLPSGFRKRMGLAEGDKLVVTVKADGALELKTGKDVAKRGRGLLTSKTKGRKLVEELLSERRRESQRE